MQENEIYDQLNVIFRTVLKKENISLRPETTAPDIAGWDSLTNIVLMGGVEKNFGIKFKLMEIMKFSNVGDMVACIEKKLAAK